MRDTMKNIIEFYYNIRIDEIHNKDDYYFFVLNKNHYIFKPYFDDIDKTLDIYKLNRLLSERTNIDNIILNRYGNPITKVNNSFYVLILSNNRNNFTLADISNMANVSDINNQLLDKLERNNWEMLWSNMIDYYEHYDNDCFCMVQCIAFFSLYLFSSFNSNPSILLSPLRILHFLAS